MRHLSNCLDALVQARYGNLVLLKWLVQHGLPLDELRAPNSQGDTPTFYAALSGHVDILNWLAEHGGAEADIHVANTHDMTPSYIAAQSGHLEVLRWLEQRGADILAEDEDGTATVTIAAKLGHSKVVKWLLRRGAVLYDDVETLSEHRERAQSLRAQVTEDFVAQHGEYTIEGSSTREIFERRFAKAQKEKLKKSNSTEVAGRFTFADLDLLERSGGDEYSREKGTPEYHLHYAASRQMLSQTDSGSIRDILSDACENCGKCGKLKTCSACGVVRFCSLSCQKENWPVHRSDCKQFQHEFQTEMEAEILDAQQQYSDEIEGVPSPKRGCFGVTESSGPSPNQPLFGSSFCSPDHEEATAASNLFGPTIRQQEL